MVTLVVTAHTFAFALLPNGYHDVSKPPSVANSTVVIGGFTDGAQCSAAASNFTNRILTNAMEVGYTVACVQNGK